MSEFPPLCPSPAQSTPNNSWRGKVANFEEEVSCGAVAVSNQSQNEIVNRSHFLMEVPSQVIQV